jgi:hypothetical protein
MRSAEASTGALGNGETNAGSLDGIGDLDKDLLVLGGILATNKNLNGETTTLERLEVLSCAGVSRKTLGLEYRQTRSHPSLPS